MTAVDIKWTVYYTSTTTMRLEFSVANLLYNGFFTPRIQDFTIGSLDSPNGVFPTYQDAYDYYASGMVNNVLFDLYNFDGGDYTAGALKRVDSYTQPKATPASHITDADTDCPTDASTSAPTDAPTNAPTNYGVLAAILGADANATNTKQNTIGTKLNSVATVVNANATKQNTIATKVNAGFGKLNAVFDALEANQFLNAA